MTTQSTLVYEELLKLIPGGVSSPARAIAGSNRTPPILKSAKGDQITDINHSEFIDFCASWGALILGHADSGQISELAAALQSGTSYGLTCVQEKYLAQRIVKLMPSIEKVRFVSSGTEATMYALRLARGVTERDYIVKYKGNYHGCADFLLTEAGSGFATHKAVSKGIPDEAVQYTLNLPYNDLEALEKLFSMPEYKNKIAAVIIEPIAANMGCVPSNVNYLKRLREITKQAGTLLVFDEVVTGFRVGPGGAQEYFDIDPDLTCLGKIVGGGFPLAAYGGKREYMDQLSPVGPIYQAGTLSGNPIAVTAGNYVLTQLEEPNFYPELNHKTNAFLSPIEDALSQKKVGCIQKVGSMFTLFFGKERVFNMQDSEQSNKTLFWKFFNTLFDQGVYWSPSPYESCFMMKSHTEEHLAIVQEHILDFIDQI
ncbi:MAG: Glutamate-1-semialdehyde 2,1-aminomutase [Chlamydiae bacterium]|nr:Glutamate-1-semialdehyde 2,1-aminomutase [Chlamydiota bacterium]